MIRRNALFGLILIGLFLTLVPGEARSILSRLLRTDQREALNLGRAVDEEWEEFVLEWRQVEDSLLTRPVKRVEIWTPFNRLAAAARDAHLRNERLYSTQVASLQRKFEQEYRDEIRFVVAYIVSNRAKAEAYRAELRPEKGDVMGPISTEALASFRWAGEYHMVRISYGFPKLLLGDWEGPVSLFLVPPAGEADGPWIFDLSKIR